LFGFFRFFRFFQFFRFFRFFRFVFVLVKVPVIEACHSADIAVCRPTDIAEVLDAPTHPVCQRFHPASCDGHGGVFTGRE